MCPEAILESALHAEDLGAAEAFYTGVMGLEVLAKLPGRHVFFRVGAGVLLIFDPRATEPVHPGAPARAAAWGPRTRPSVLCRDAGRIARWRARLAAAGIAAWAKKAQIGEICAESTPKEEGGGDTISTARKPLSNWIILIIPTRPPQKQAFFVHCNTKFPITP